MSSIFDMTNKQKATHKHVGKLVGVYIESKAFHDANPGLTEEECAALIPLICIFAGIDEQDAPNDEVFLKDLHTNLTRHCKDNSTENVDSFFDKAATVKIVSDECIDSVAPDDWAKHVTAMRKKYDDMSEHLYGIERAKLKELMLAEVEKEVARQFGDRKDVIFFRKQDFLNMAKSDESHHAITGICNGEKKQFSMSNEEVKHYASCVESGWSTINEGRQNRAKFAELMKEVAAQYPKLPEEGMLPLLTALRANREQKGDQLFNGRDNMPTLFLREVMEVLKARAYIEPDHPMVHCGMVIDLAGLATHYPESAFDPPAGWIQYLRYVGERYEHMFEQVQCDGKGCTQCRAKLRV